MSKQFFYLDNLVNNKKGKDVIIIQFLIVSHPRQKFRVIVV